MAPRESKMRRGRPRRLLAAALLAACCGGLLLPRGAGGLGDTEQPQELCFVRLALDRVDGKAAVDLLAEKWTALLRNGGYPSLVYAVDEATVLINAKARDLVDTREFALAQEETREFECANEVWDKQGRRRASPPPGGAPPKAKPRRAGAGRQAQAGKKAKRKRRPGAQRTAPGKKPDL